MARATTPLVPPSAAVDRLAQPGLNDSKPWAMAKGFGSGVLEGLRQQTSPVNLAGLATLPMGLGAGKAAVGAADALAGVVPELVDAAQGVKQVVPMADDVTRLAHTLRQRLLQVPSSAKVATKLGQTAQEFTPVGGESVLNAAREGMTKVASPARASVQDTLYKRIMASGKGNVGEEMKAYQMPTGVIGSETGEISPGAAAGTAGLVGAGGYVGKQLYDMLQQAKNPIKQASGVLDKAAQ